MLRCLKNQLQNAEIHFLTKKKFYGLLEFNPHVSKIITLETDLTPVLRQLKEEKYDVVIDLHHNLRSLRVKLALGRPSFSFSKLNVRKFLYVSLKASVMPDVHIVARYLKAVQALGVEDDGGGLEFFPCDCDRVVREDLPPAFRHQPFAVLCIGGTHFTKKMPAEKWMELIARLPFPAIVVGGNEDVAQGQRIENLAREHGNVVWNACGKFTIGGSAHVVRLAHLVATHDTGMMHIAAAFGIPTIAIWGNTTPQLGMEPFRTKHINLEVNDLSCRPCSKIGFSACPKGHFRCMNAQNFNRPEVDEFISEAFQNKFLHG